MKWKVARLFDELYASADTITGAAMLLLAFLVGWGLWDLVVWLFG